MKVILCTAAAFLTMSAAQAEKWEWQPRIELGYQYDDNYRLDLPDSEIDVSGGMLDAQLKLLSTGQLTTWSLTPRLHTNYFPDDPAEESDDYYLLYDFTHTGQKLRTNVNAQYSDESVVRSEIPTELPGVDPDVGLGEGGGADSGRLSIRNRRQMAQLFPSLHYTLSQRRGFELGARYLDVEFEDILTEQVSYVDYGVFGGFSFVQSPRTTLTLRALANRYDPETRSNEATAYGAQAEWSNETTQTTRTYLRIGAQRTAIDRVSFLGTTTETKTNYVAGAGGEWTGQRHSVLIDATHNIGPTSSGFVVERDQLRFRVTRRLTEHADFLLGIRGVRDDAVEDDVIFATRTYASGNIGFQWRIVRQFGMAAMYDYTWQEFSDEPSDRKSQGATLSFVYEPFRRQ